MCDFDSTGAGKADTSNSAAQLEGYGKLDLVFVSHTGGIEHAGFSEVAGVSSSRVHLFSSGKAPESIVHVVRPQQLSSWKT